MGYDLINKQENRFHFHFHAWTLLLVLAERYGNWQPDDWLDGFTAMTDADAQALAAALKCIDLPDERRTPDTVIYSDVPIEQLNIPSDKIVMRVADFKSTPPDILVVRSNETYLPSPLDYWSGRDLKPFIAFCREGGFYIL